jgi:ADP-ribose pyrophosphatase YjhB (NUDIX family)
MKKGFDYTGISVVTMCHDGKVNYLMEHRSPLCRDEKNTWSPVGSGGVKFKERLVDAVRREVKEECGANAVNLEFLGYREVFRKNGEQETYWIAFDFKAQIDPHDVVIGEPHKCDELRWCTIDEIPEPRHSQFPVFLEKYKDIL